MNNTESDASSMAGRSGDAAIADDSNNKLELLLTQMSAMTSTVEKALSELPKSCANAMHDCMHLISNAINKGKLNQNTGQSNSSQ